jgi:hypothetical protein
MVMTANPERRQQELLGPDARTRFGEDAERFDGRIEDSEPYPCPKTQRKETAGTCRASKKAYRAKRSGCAI